MDLEELINQINKLLKDISPLLKKQLPDQNSFLISELTKLDTYYWPIMYFMAHLKEYITKIEAEKFQALDSVKKRSEKEMIIHSEIAHLIKLLEILEGAGDALKRKISLGQTVLRSKMGERYEPQIH